MCFDYDSLPPIPRLAGAAIAHEDLRLTSADGTEFAAFLATSDAPGRAGVVILPDVRGLYRFYEELALRFAERGIPAIAIDYFGRTAGVDKRDEDFEWMPHVQATVPARIQEDVAAAAERLRATGSDRIVTVGFCFGGRHSWLAASSDLDLAGAVGFYGMAGPAPVGGDGPTPIESVGSLHAPVLGLMGGSDEHIPPEAVQEYEDALTAAGADHEIVVYEGAPHSFFDREQHEFAAASEDAWRRTLAFIEARAAG